MEFEARKLRALISSTRLIADDLQVIEEDAVETPEESRMPMDWTDGSDRALAAYRASRSMTRAPHRRSRTPRGSPSWPWPP